MIKIRKFQVHGPGTDDLNDKLLTMMHQAIRIQNNTLPNCQKDMRSYPSTDRITYIHTYT